MATGQINSSSEKKESESGIGGSKSALGFQREKDALPIPSIEIHPPEIIYCDLDEKKKNYALDQGELATSILYAVTSTTNHA